MTSQEQCPAEGSLQEADAAGNTSDPDVDQQLPCESAGDNSLPVFPLPDVPHPDVPLPDVHPDASVGEE